MKTPKNKRTAKSPTLRFSPYAWAKLLFLRDLGETEVGGFGICRGEDLLHVDDVQLVKQTCTTVTVEFDDASVADFFDRHVDAGLKLENCARVWIHTHPGNCALPSGTDEATFARVFGASNWSLMFILAQGGECYARLQFNVGPGTSQELDVEIDYSQPFAATDWHAWEQEHHANVRAECFLPPLLREQEPDALASEIPDAWHDAWHRYSDDDCMEISKYELF